MSDYVREKVLRVPMDRINFEHIKAKLRELDKDYDDDFSYYLETAFPDLFDYRSVNKFSVAPTTESYFDYVLDYEYGADGEYGKVRDLYDSEKAKYLPVFQQIDPNINMGDVKLVEFCWYNCCEAPDYYDTTNDPFYDEI